MADKPFGNIGLTSLDDLFKTDAERQDDQSERVQIVPAEKVFPYARQPYSIERPTPDLVRLMDSIERNGIAEPMIVRPREGGTYEIIAGHRRDYCARAVGLQTRPVIVRECTDEEADILVVDYNITREDLLPSEKARAYKLKLDAMRRTSQVCLTMQRGSRFGAKSGCQFAPVICVRDLPTVLLNPWRFTVIFRRREPLLIKQTIKPAQNGEKSEVKQDEGTGQHHGRGGVPKRGRQAGLPLY